MPEVTPVIHRIQIGSTLHPLGVNLVRRDGTPIDATGKTVKFVAFDEDGTEAIAETEVGVTVTDADAVDGAEVQYDFSTADVSTAARLFGYFRLYDGAEFEPIPEEPTLVIEIVDPAHTPGPLTGYTTREAIRKRLTSVGYQWTADRNQSGGVTEQELVDVIDPAIDYAGNMVAGAIAHLVDPAAAASLSNAWLRDRALDIAAFRATTQGGRRTPKVLRDDYERALEMLNEVLEGTRKVPGLTGATASAARGITAIQTHSDNDQALRYGRGHRRSTWPH